MHKLKVTSKANDLSGNELTNPCHFNVTIVPLTRNKIMYKGSSTNSCTNLRIHAFLDFISEKVILDGSRDLYSCYVWKTE